MADIFREFVILNRPWSIGDMSQCAFTFIVSVNYTNYTSFDELIRNGYVLTKISGVILRTRTTILSYAGSSLISQMVNLLLLLIIQPKSLREVEITLGKFQAEKDPFEKKFVN